MKIELRLAEHFISFNKFNNIAARKLDSIYHMTLKLLSNLIFAMKMLRLSICTQKKL